MSTTTNGLSRNAALDLCRTAATAARRSISTPAIAALRFAWNDLGFGEDEVRDVLAQILSVGEHDVELDHVYELYPQGGREQQRRVGAGQERTTTARPPNRPSRGERSAPRRVSGFSRPSRVEHTAPRRVSRAALREQASTSQPHGLREVREPDAVGGVDRGAVRGGSRHRSGARDPQRAGPRRAAAQRELDSSQHLHGEPAQAEEQTGSAASPIRLDDTGDHQADDTQGYADAPVAHAVLPPVGDGRYVRRAANRALELPPGFYAYEEVVEWAYIDGRLCGRVRWRDCWVAATDLDGRDVQAHEREGRDERARRRARQN